MDASVHVVYSLKLLFFLIVIIMLLLKLLKKIELYNEQVEKT